MTDPCWPQGVPRIMPADDRGEITELYARYAWGIDLADEEQAIATFARDAKILTQAGYKLNWVQVVDQFRWSPHVELVAQFTL